MFELLTDVHTVPLDSSRLTTVQRGMNKVRVSVAEHISEPSEVSIITGQSGGKMETYIIFYMLEPGIRVVYGFDRNPYPADERQPVLEEAADFVEEMGAILEEIPLEEMTPEQRQAWFEKEVLYETPESGTLLGVEEIEELEIVEYEGQGEEETAEADGLPEGHQTPEAGIVKVTEGEVQELLAEGDPEGDAEISEGHEDGTEPDRALPDAAGQGRVDGVEAAGTDDVVVAESDFDELLKQAFLKPDIVEKTRRKSGSAVETPVKDHPESEDITERDEEDSVLNEEAAPVPFPAAEDKDLQKGRPGETPGPHDPSQREQGEGGGTAQKEAGVSVIRFLSKF